MARLRMVAGPNGSGKTNLTKYIFAQGLKWGVYINADDIEEELRRKSRKLSFEDYNVEIDGDELKAFYSDHALHGLSPAAFFIEKNTLRLTSPLSDATYFGTLVADFLRQKLFEEKLSFSFETVMSDTRKIDLLADTKNAGYRNCLYFVCTNNPEINISRVADRVKKNGHNVPEHKIRKRYARTLANLIPAIQQTDRTFLFDNSGYGPKLVAQIVDGHEITFDGTNVPKWVREHLLNKF